MMPKYRTMQDAVKEFQTAFNRPTDLNFSDIGNSISVTDTFDLRRSLIEEEFYELIYAIDARDENNIKKESADLLYDLAGLLFLHAPSLYVGVLSLNGSNNISIVALGVTKDLTSDNNR